MAALNSHLESSMFLLGERISAADIVVAAAAYDVFTLVMTRGAGSAQAVSARRWFDTVLVTGGLDKTAASLGLSRGGLAREGGQVDLKPDSAAVGAMADASIKLNVGQKKTKSQRDAEKAAKDGAAGDAAAPAASSGAATSPASSAAAGVAATSEQPASNEAAPLSVDESVSKTVAALTAAGLDASTYPVHRHRAVTDMAGLREVTGAADVVLCKNLFLKAKKARPGDAGDQRMWLLLARDETSTDLKAIADALG